MCGIIGILKNTKNIDMHIFDFLLLSLTQLQNRGYDSSGVCMVNSDDFIVQKYASCTSLDSLDKLKNMKVEVKVEDNILSIEGSSKEDKADFVHQGIAKRSFRKQFQLADYVECNGGKLEDGMLKIKLEYNPPEAKKPKQIKIA